MEVRDSQQQILRSLHKVGVVEVVSSGRPFGPELSPGQLLELVLAQFRNRLAPSEDSSLADTQGASQRRDRAEMFNSLRARHFDFP